MTFLRQFILLLLFSSCLQVNGQLPFRGSFTMSFSEAGPGQKKAWPFLCTVDVTKIGLEVQDDMSKKGVTKRIVYDLADSAWLMLMQYNKIKQGTRINSRSMYKDSMPVPEVKIKQSQEIKTISGYTCKKYVAISETDSAIMWVARDINFDLCRLYKLLAHCGMMNSYVDGGTWFYTKPKGMVLEVTSFDRKTKENYTMTISGIQPNDIRFTFFDLEGFKIADIPEGQNCGPMTNEKK